MTAVESGVPFSPAELVICVIAVAGAMTGIAALATGAITI